MITPLAVNLPRRLHTLEVDQLLRLVDSARPGGHSVARSSSSSNAAIACATAAALRGALYLDPELGEYRAVLVSGAQVLIERERFHDGYTLPPAS